MAAISVLSCQLGAGNQPVTVGGEGGSPEPASSVQPLPGTQLPALHLLQTLCSQPVHSDLCGEVVGLAKQQWAWSCSWAGDEQVRAGEGGRAGGHESLLFSQVLAAVVPASVLLLATVVPLLHLQDLADVNLLV